MQTFVPYPDCVLEGTGSVNWKNHPAVKMWDGHVVALKYYHDCMINEWTIRGYKNNMKLLYNGVGIVFPSWWGSSDVHSSHRAALKYKFPDYYCKFN